MVPGEGVGDRREVPSGFLDCIGERDHSNLLPTEATLKEYRITSFEVEGWGWRRRVTYVLYDRWEHIVYQWPDDYVPSWVDVFEVCKSF